MIREAMAVALLFAASAVAEQAPRPPLPASIERHIAEWSDTMDRFIKLTRRPLGDMPPEVLRQGLTIADTVLNAALSMAEWCAQLQSYSLEGTRCETTDQDVQLVREWRAEVVAELEARTLASEP
jgi:hypothetical protein